jgi:hypothetical protein
MSSVKTFEVGQSVFVVVRGRERHCKVTKVGRRWVELDAGYRFESSNMQLDGGKYSSPGSVWNSESAYRENVALYKAWDKLAKCLYRKTPQVTLEKVRQAAELLGVNLDAE